MHDRSEWTRGRTGSFELRSTTGKMKTYNGLTEFTRTCATCSEPFSIHVTSKIAAGHADSNSFGLKNCEKHRRSPVRGSQVNDETLLIANKTMKEELDGLYERTAMQAEEIQQLKSRLAKYELQPAMEAVSQAVDLPDAQMTFPLQRLTFPWETS